MVVKNHWTGPTGMDYCYWTDLFFPVKIIFMAYSKINKIPLPVKLHPGLDQSVIVSSISLHKQQMKMMLLLLPQEKETCVQFV